MKLHQHIRPGKKVGIVGFGVAGVAMARYCRRLGAEVVVSDARPAERFLQEAGPVLRDLGITSWETGGQTETFLSPCDLLIVSPGVDTRTTFYQRLRVSGAVLCGELALAAEVLRAETVAITGTNGKTTVTTLIGEMVKAAGKNVFVGGNIGTPIGELLLAPEVEVAVLEVSSFQLELAGDFAPKVGVLLNITPDHLDRHGDMAGYRQAKMGLFARQGAGDVAIVNGDDPLCVPSDSLGSQLLSFGRSVAAEARIGDGEILVQTGSDRMSYRPAVPSLGQGVGLANSAAAILAARCLGISAEVIARTLNSFQALPHRLELVAEVAGVRYYDDSKATNTGAVLAALSQLQAGVVLIAGGRDKGDEYRLMRPLIAAKVSHLVLIGEAAPLLQQALGDMVKTLRAASMEEAVELAAGLATPGQSVLMSPACASFDMFANYKDRGKRFAAAVRQLASRSGPERC